MVTPGAHSDVGSVGSMCNSRAVSFYCQLCVDDSVTLPDTSEDRRLLTIDGDGVGYALVVPTTETRETLAPLGTSTESHGSRQCRRATRQRAHYSPPEP
jgi:hypothetical protein